MTYFGLLFARKEGVFSLFFVFVLLTSTLTHADIIKPTDKAFDHLATGFPLTGQHQFIACEACHIVPSAANVMIHIFQSGNRLIIYRQLRNAISAI